MSEMVERVARAICESAEADDFDALAPGSIYRALYVQQARHAIEAMREPTEAMVVAAAETPGMKAAGSAMELHQARGYGFAEGSFDDGSPLHQAWQAMIDEALK